MGVNPSPLLYSSLVSCEAMERVIVRECGVEEANGSRADERRVRGLGCDFRGLPQTKPGDSTRSNRNRADVTL